MLTAPVVIVAFLKRFMLTPGRREWAARAAAWGGEFHPEAPGFYGHVLWVKDGRRMRLAEAPGLRGWETRLILQAEIPPDRRFRACAGDAPLVAFLTRWGFAGATLVARRSGCTLVLPGRFPQGTQAAEIVRDARALLEEAARDRGEGKPR